MGRGKVLRVFAEPTHCRRYEGRVEIGTGAVHGLVRVIPKRLAEERAIRPACHS